MLSVAGRPALEVAGPRQLIVRFDAHMDEALYGASGFYVRGGRPTARGGDFVTSVELGSLFAQCVAGYLDRVWHELGRPDPFVVVEGGAGRGTLCSQVLQHAGECRRSLHYVMAERVDRQRTEAREQIEALTADVPTTALADLPTGPLNGVVLANELLDNLPFRLLERSTTGWQEVCIAEGEPDGASGGELDSGPDNGADQPVGDIAAEPSPAALSDAVGLALGEDVRHVPSEVLVAAPADAAAMADALVPHAEPGARVPLQLKAAVWVRRALRLLERGRLLVFDYGVPTTAGLAERPTTDWLRTYRAHRRGDDPLDNPGSADITCEVAFDQLPPGATLTAQADWLGAAGIDDMTATARNLWQRSRANPTAEALAARTLLDEAAALTDPDGMGAFWAAEWRVG